MDEKEMERALKDLNECVDVLVMAVRVAMIGASPAKQAQLFRALGDMAPLGTRAARLTQDLQRPLQ